MQQKYNLLLEINNKYILLLEIQFKNSTLGKINQGVR